MIEHVNKRESSKQLVILEQRLAITHIDFQATISEKNRYSNERPNPRKPLILILHFLERTFTLLPMLKD